ncbi:hypothetical protein BH10BAC3_BH10BAC3_19300 [soil metagenome]
MEENQYKMDRSVLSANTFEVADDHVSFWEDKTSLERLNAACFIINNIYNVTAQTKVDKTLVTVRKHGDG